MRFSLATKIFVGFSLVLVAFGAVSLFGVLRLGTVRDQLGTIHRGYLPLSQVVFDIEAQREATRRNLDILLQLEDQTWQRDQIQSMRQTFSRNLLARLEQARTIIRRLQAGAVSSRDARILEDIVRRLERIGTAGDDFCAAMDVVVQSLELGSIPAGGDANEIVALRASGLSLARDVRLLKFTLKNVMTSQLLQVERNESAAMGVALWLTILALVVGIAITALSLWALRPVRRLAEAARRISAGDFSRPVDVTSRDEFAELAVEFNRMARALAQREEQLVGQQAQLEEANRQMRQSSIDLELIKRYNEHIVRSAHNGILVADALGVVTTLNPAAEELFGLEPTSTIGQRLPDLSLGPAWSSLAPGWERALIHRERALYESLEFQPAGSSIVLVDLYVSPLSSPAGEILGILLEAEDVTEKVRTKQALLQSERLATIGRMSAVVAHEIRNPLSSIGLNTEVLLEELQAQESTGLSEARKVAESIAREVERLTEVTDEYLRYARMPKPALVPEQPNEILEDLLRFLANELTAAGITVQQRFDPQLRCVSADENQLRQAFLNLIKNSIEAMPTGGELSIATELADGTVRIRIHDTGKGIEPACIDRIFDPFFSARDSGTGLGLSLTQQIVTEHGGRIECMSEPGKGATFTVSLPAVDGSPPSTT